MKKNKTKKLDPNIAKDTSPVVPQKNKIKNELTIYKRELNEKQKSFVELALDKKTQLMFVSGPAGTSKAQPLSADVLSTTGWIKMGEIKPGMLVFGDDGKPYNVLSIHPQGIKDIYKVSFSDGTSTECTLDHLWLTQTSDDRNFRTKVKGIRYKSTEKRGTVKTTKQILDTLISRPGKHQRWNHSIQTCQPVEFSEINHFISPYIMGVLLGDGCFRGKRISLSCAEDEILKRVSQEIPDGMELNFQSKYEYNIRHINKKLSNGGNKIRNELKRLGLDNHLSCEKFIPNEYLFDSIKNRIDILRGLLDTDGHVTNGGNSSYFTTTSIKLMESVRFLVESLGGVCNVNIRNNWFTYLNEKKQGKDSYSMCICMPPHINPFCLSRKYNLVKPKSKYQPIRYIVKIEFIKKEECQCILIDNPTHLYLTNNFIVTHNTFMSIFVALTLMNQKKISDILYLRSAVESSDSKIGFLPGDAKEKMSPYMQPLLDKLAEFLPKSEISHLEKENRIDSIPIGFLRGLNWNAKCVIADECQNMTLKELITLITRIGEFSKVFIIGDPDQADIGNKSGFSKLKNFFDSEEDRNNGIVKFEFTEDDIVRSGLVKYIIKKIKNL